MRSDAAHDRIPLHAHAHAHPAARPQLGVSALGGRGAGAGGEGGGGGGDGWWSVYSGAASARSSLRLSPRSGSNQSTRGGGGFMVDQSAWFERLLPPALSFDATGGADKMGRDAVTAPQLQVEILKR